MAAVQKVSVAVTPEMAEMMRELVNAGEYASSSELVREALREWKFRRMRRRLAVEELGRLWDKGIESGEPIDDDAVFAEVRSTLEARLADRATR